MKQIKYILFIITALGIVSCTDEGSAFKSSRFVSLSVNMPDGEPTTRVGVSLVEGSKNLSVSFSADDKFSIYVRQGDVIQEIENVTFTVNSENGKQGTLAFEMPVSIDMSKTYTMYGVCETSNTSSYIWNDILKIDCVSNVAPLSEFQVPVWFEYTGQGSPSTIQCQYIGTFIVIHINNKSDTDNHFQIANVSCDGMLSKGGGFCWDENTKDFYDNEIVTTISSQDLPIAAGKSATFIYNDMPNGKVMESIDVCMRIGQNITLATEEQIPTSPKTVGKILEQGRAYHLYMTWDSKELKFEKGETSVSQGEAVDLGLPSGTKWATCNVGAKSPEEFGDYFAWGEIARKDSYDWETYHYYIPGTYYSCTYIGEEIGGTSYDVATAQWGGNWKMPSKTQMKELIDNCTCEWTSLNGVNGLSFKGPNGRSIFMPAAGYYEGYYGNYFGSGYSGYYWASTYYRDSGYPGVTHWAYTMKIGDGGSSATHEKAYLVNDSRSSGLSVRPVSNADGELDDVPGYEL